MIKKRGSLKHNEFLTQLKEAIDSGAVFTDTHAHIHFNQLTEDLDGVMQRAADNGVHRIVTIGIDLKDSVEAQKVSNKLDNVFFSVGVHPHDAAQFELNQLAKFEAMLSDPKCIAVGEIGLDYYYDHSPRNIQKDVFAMFLDMAKANDKPVIIHNRDSAEDCVDVLRSVVSGRERNGIIHCFSGDRGLQKWALDNGFYISYAGPVTYNKAQDLRDTVQYVPKNRLFVETDSPYLSPEPYRGKTNEPANVVYNASEICEIINDNLHNVAVQLESNYTQLFG
jgi:TatD DNase family protein